jgi:drug/metabolite transporter (DMT)-like permease
MAGTSPAMTESVCLMSPRTATLFGLSAIIMWSLLAVLTVATGKIPAFQLAAMTFAIGALVAFASFLFRPSAFAALKQPLVAWVVGVGGLFGYHALYFAALRLAPPAEASLVAYLWPLLIVLMSAALPGERLGARHVLGALIGFGGAAVLFWGKVGAAGAPALSANAELGYLLALGCAFVWSSYSVLSRFLKRAPTESVAGFCLVTAALAGLCHAACETTAFPTNFTQAAAIVGLGLGPVGLAFYVWDYGVKNGDIRLLGVAAYAAPVLSTLILVAAGFAPAMPSLALACALIVGGAVVASRKG